MSTGQEINLEKNPAPGFAQHPEHEVTCRLFRGEVVVSFDGTEVARSREAVLVEETNHLPVYYILPEHVAQDHLRESSHVTRCPFKGKARYWNLRVGDHEIDNAVWSYETPYDEVLELASLMAFYASKVDIEVMPA